MLTKNMNKKIKKEDLIKFNGNVKEASLFFKKSERTIRRWLKKENLYNPQSKYNPKKLSQEDAKKIRNEYLEGVNQINLSKKYKVSQATIANVVNNKVYKYNFILSGFVEYKYSANIIPD